MRVGKGRVNVEISIEIGENVVKEGERGFGR